MRRKIVLFFSLILLSQLAQAQIGIGVKGGVNIANQDIKSSSNIIDVNTLTAFQLGVVYQYTPKYLMFGRWGLGLETGIMFTQKGSLFEYTDEEIEFDLEEKEIIIGYNEFNYLEIPLNLQVRFRLGSNVSLFAYGGMYAGCLLRAKTVVDQTKSDKAIWEFNHFSDRWDYGYSFGFGLDVLRRFQVSLNWSNSLQNIVPTEFSEYNIDITSIYNRVYSINIAFLF